MKRIDHPSAGQDRSGKRIFTEGNPQIGTPATVLTASWLNTVQEELCNLLERNGVQLDGGDSSQLFKLLRRQERQPVGVGDFAQVALSEGAAMFLDFCDTPAGVVGVTVNGEVMLFRGGRMLSVYSHNEHYRWASLCCHEGLIFMAALGMDEGAKIKTVRYRAASHFVAGGMQAWRYVGTPVGIGVGDASLELGVDPGKSLFIEMVTGRLLEPGCLLFVRLVQDRESMVQRLEAVIHWSQTNTNAILGQHELLGGSPYRWNPDVNPFNRACCASGVTSSGKLGVACLLPDNDRVWLTRGRVEETSLVDTQMDPLEVEKCAVVLDTGDAADLGMRLLWSDALAHYVAYQPGGTRFYAASAEHGAPIAMDTGGRPLVGCVQLGSELVVIARDKDGLANGKVDGMVIGRIEGASTNAMKIQWLSSLDVPGLAFGSFVQAHLSISFPAPPWRDLRATVARDLLTVQVGSVVAASRNPLYGPWAVAASVDLVRLVGEDSAGRHIAVDASGNLLIGPVIG